MMQSVIKEHYDKILAVVKRAQKMKIAQFGQCTQFIDISIACDQFSLRLDDMIAANDFDFAHDFVGIQNNIDRDKGKITRFVPRFSGLSE